MPTSLVLTDMVKPSPAHRGSAEAVSSRPPIGSSITSITVLLVTVVSVAHSRMALSVTVMATDMLSPSARVFRTRVLAVSPASTAPFNDQAKSGFRPPLVGVAVKVTVSPGHEGSISAVTTTEGVTAPVTLKVTEAVSSQVPS